MKIQKLRLLNVARALRESKNPQDFTMRHEFNNCGTPACAWGHYVDRTDLQDHFYATVDDRDSGFVWSLITGEELCYDDTEVLEHFGVSEEEASDLFAVRGCGKAKTTIEAAEWIERFAEAKWPEVGESIVTVERAVPVESTVDSE